jgi:arylsulfatase A-like enzyme
MLAGTARSVLLLLGVLVACTRPPATPPNVVVVLVDTLRADRLGVYSGSRRLSPFLDSFAARATVFTHAYAASSWTNPSVASLFTSRFPSQHGVISFGARLDASELTIAEVLASHGYATGAFVANGLLVADNGFGQGFDTYRSYWVPGGKKRVEDLAPDVLAWVDGLPKTPSRPVFLYLHYVEPHSPYSPPVAMLDRVLAGRPRPNPGIAGARTLFDRGAPMNATELRDLEDVYDAEVLSFDAALRETFAALEARHVLDDAIVVVTADHGDEFHDHGQVGHGQSLYNELIHVPLIVRYPHQSGSVRVEDTVSLVDVAPTLLDTAGIELPAAFEGNSLRTSWFGSSRRATALSELISSKTATRLTPHERAIVLGERKLIVGVGEEREEYDLARDPAETKRLEEPTPKTQTLLAALRAFETHLHPDRPAAAATPVSPELRERMRALGYVE